MVVPYRKLSLILYKIIANEPLSNSEQIVWLKWEELFVAFDKSKGESIIEEMESFEQLFNEEDRAMLDEMIGNLPLVNNNSNGFKLFLEIIAKCLGEGSLDVADSNLLNEYEEAFQLRVKTFKFKDAIVYLYAEKTHKSTETFMEELYRDAEIIQRADRYFKAAFGKNWKNLFPD